MGGSAVGGGSLLSGQRILLLLKLCVNAALQSGPTLMKC